MAESGVSPVFKGGVWQNSIGSRRLAKSSADANYEYDIIFTMLVAKARLAVVHWKIAEPASRGAARLNGVEKVARERAHATARQVKPKFQVCLVKLG